MILRRTICLILILLFSAGGLYTAVHLTELHYKNPDHQLSLIKTVPYMQRWFPRAKIEKAIKDKQKAEIASPYDDKNFNPYENQIKVTPKKSESKEACDVSSTWSCTGVDESPFSEMHGIGMGVYGFIGYSLLVLLTLIHLALRRPKSDFFSFMLYCGAFIALGSSIKLTTIEAFILHKYCPYCIGSAAVSALIFICALIGFGIEPAAVFLKGGMFPTSLFKPKSGK
jgi:uncharacterized membrane protein